MSAAIFGVAQTAVFALILDFARVFGLIFVILAVLFGTAVSLVYSVPSLVLLSAIEFAYRVLVALWNRATAFRL